jgi:nucleotide-binding universal stress UspA family protein
MKEEEDWINALAAEALDILGNYDLKASLQIYSGNPRIMLARGANEWKADTIFVGKSSRQSNLLGCVASAVAQRASCSIEVIPRMQGG